ncbi:hypothetical protein OMW55_01840 [Sphingomonas sp. BN140010]|uniref:Polymerase n=1 Tax=Sphingomonas arvum TaxID=2992113 RepID=A0ABT3JBV4_9SPHN|nr:hypothetical protein [Sphingomonas sp. BN140010]MCW3796550.1 hypothetical protein [Sphingomonas sp. BN140010]
MTSGDRLEPVHGARLRPVGAQARAAAVPVSAPAALARPDGATLRRMAIALVLAGVLYNAVLSFLNGHAMSVSYALVVVTEIAVLGVAALTLLRTGLRPTDNPALALLGFFLVDACLVSLASGALFVDMARNASIIAIFSMIGMRTEERTVRRIVAILAGLIFAFLLLESVSVQSYADLLAPGLYFEQTRGISRFELDEIGLFANAVGFADRFSILNIVGHRTSSLFLEQVSLANYATVLTTFLVCMWQGTSKKARVAYIFLIVFILVTNNSRTALAISLAAPLVYWAAPKLPRFINLALMPTVLVAAFIVAATSPPTKEDNLVGRLSLTVKTLKELDVTALLGGSATEAAKFADSGYTYLIYASSIIGLLVLWLFFSLVLAGERADQKRGSMMISLYLFLNLTVSGTSVFSIKTAALLWLLVGFLRLRSAPETAETTAEEPIELRPAPATPRPPAYQGLR